MSEPKRILSAAKGLDNTSRFITIVISWLCGGLKRRPLWVILCRLPEKGKKEIEEIVEEMKERDGGEREQE